MVPISLLKIMKIVYTIGYTTTYNVLKWMNCVTVHECIVLKSYLFTGSIYLYYILVVFQCLSEVPLVTK